MKNFYSIIVRIMPKFIKLFLKDIYYVSTGNYITKKIKGDKQKYLQIFEDIKTKKYDQIDDFINSKNLKEVNKDFINDNKSYLYKNKENHCLNKNKELVCCYCLNYHLNQNCY